MNARLLLIALATCSLLAAAVPSSTQEIPPPDERTAGDVLPYRLLYGKPGKTSPDETACYVWNEGGRLHLRITADGKSREVQGSLRAKPDGVLKDVSLDAPGIRIRQPVPWLLQFDLRTSGRDEEISVVLAGDTQILRVDLRIDGKSRPDALRIGERQERPQALPADLAFSGAQASWIERFGFE